MSRRNCAIGKDVVPASFKGVQFWCTEADVEGGRRGAEGEFPFGEITAYADLGRKIRVYHLTAVFREDDHVSDASALFTACESPGPGILVHPTRGTQMVACRSCKVSDKLEEAQGESTAELEFVEANIAASVFGGSLFGVLPDSLNTTSRDSFMVNYQPTQVSQPWRTDVINTAQKLVEATAKVVAQVITVAGSAEEWRKLLHMEQVARDDGLASLAVEVDEGMVNGMNMIANNVQDAHRKYKLYRLLVNFAAFSSPEGPAFTSGEAAISRHRLLGAIGMAEAAMARRYRHLDEALETKDTVLAVFKHEEEAAFANCENALYLEIVKYSVEFDKMMYDLAYRLPGLVLVNFAGGVHPLVAGYVIYKDAKRHRELEERNVVDANGRFAPLVAGVVPL
jgi:hypothetical protein